MNNIRAAHVFISLCKISVSFRGLRENGFDHIIFELKIELENELTHFFEFELIHFQNELSHLSLTHFFSY